MFKRIITLVAAGLIVGLLTPQQAIALPRDWDPGVKVDFKIPRKNRIQLGWGYLEGTWSYTPARMQSVSMLAEIRVNGDFKGELDLRHRDIEGRIRFPQKWGTGTVQIGPVTTSGYDPKYREFFDSVDPRVRTIEVKRGSMGWLHAGMWAGKPIFDVSGWIYNGHRIVDMPGKKVTIKVRKSGRWRKYKTVKFGKIDSVGKVVPAPPRTGRTEYRLVYRGTKRVRGFKSVPIRV